MILLITTCARPGANYLRQLVDDIDRSDWNGPRFIVSDGPSPAISDWPVLASPTREGQKRNYWRALELGLDVARESGDDRILILEDDVELCRNALPYMARLQVPDEIDFVTWYDWGVVPAGSANGIHHVPAKHFFCLQGVTWPARTAEALVRSPISNLWMEPHRGDLLIPLILQERHYGVHVPNLVQHRGEVSLCNPGDTLGGFRVSTSYAGREFDALKLFEG